MKISKFIIILLICSTINSYGAEITDNAVTEIQIDGIQRIDKETVIAYSNININDTYTEELGNNALKSLFETDLFSNIEISFKDNLLIIKVSENPTVNLIKFEGNKKINDEDLLLEISLNERSIYSRSKVKKDLEKMLTLYQRAGRLSTEINPTIEMLENNRVNLTYEIDESSVAEVSKISIVGNENFTSSKIKSIMKTKQKKLLRPWSTSDNYDPDKLEYDKQLITEFYNDNGFPNFKFTSSIAQLIPNKNSFEIILTLNEGEMFNFGTISAETELDKLSSDAIINSVSTKEGALYQSSLIKESISLIRDQASMIGYTFIEIYPKLIPDDDSKTVNINFKINEGPRVYVKNINISGNTRTIDKVIRRQVKLSEGDAYNKYAIDLSKDTIRSLGFFGTVDIEEVRVIDSDRVNINIHVEEKNTGEVSAGAGYSSTSKTSVTFGLKEKNFLGKGQKANFQASFADTQSTYDISFEEPYYNNKNLSLRGDLYSRFSDPTSVRYETEDLGAGFSIRFPLAPTLSYGFSYELFTTKVKADANASSYEKLLAGTDTVSSVTNTFSSDRRNSPYKPSSGHLSRLTSTIAGVGGTSYYIKNFFDHSRYKRLSKSFVGAFKIEAGHLNGYNDKYAPITSNYKLGGKNLRGFKAGRVGPKSGNSYYGGQYYYLTSLETNLELPIDEFDITSVFFIDAGSVWGLDSRYGSIDDDHKLRSSAGVNFLWDSAIGPINLIYAKAINKESTDSLDSFYFDIGYLF
tara:strand:- start:990 stop:3242 length:2253 start_codon:yes stop_codon:yes gene_type:complete